VDREENRTSRRDKARAKKKHGMKVSGKGVGVIMRNVIIKRRKGDSKARTSL
jgi:hypothetical protein